MKDKIAEIVMYAITDYIIEKNADMLLPSPMATLTTKETMLMKRITEEIMEILPKE